MIEIPLLHPFEASGSGGFQFFKGGSAATLPWSSPSVVAVGLECDLFLRATVLSGSLQ